MRVKFEGLSLASIAARLRTYAGRTVIDRTGLTVEVLVIDRLEKPTED